MPTVERFDRAQIEKYLSDRGLGYAIDSEGDFVVRYPATPEKGGELNLWFVAGGPDATICQVQIESRHPIPRADWPRAIDLCNTWNSTRRWPKAYLQVADPESDLTGVIYLEGQIELGAGIHQELLADFSDTVISAGLSFWEWAHQEQGLSAAPEVGRPKADPASATRADE